MVQQKLDVFHRKGQSKDPDLNGFNRHLKDEEFGGGGRFELEVHKLRREQASAGSSSNTCSRRKRRRPVAVVDGRYIS